MLSNYLHSNSTLSPPRVDLSPPRVDLEMITRDGRRRMLFIPTQSGLKRVWCRFLPYCFCVFFLWLSVYLWSYRTWTIFWMQLYYVKNFHITVLLSVFFIGKYSIKKKKFTGLWPGYNETCLPWVSSTDFFVSFDFCEFWKSFEPDSLLLPRNADPDSNDA